VPLLIVTYRVLAEFVHGCNQPMRLAEFEHPWIRSVRDARTGRTRHVRLPAAAVLERDSGAAEPPSRVLLLPDVGTVPVASHRRTVRGLIELRRAYDADDQQENEPLLVVAVASPGSSVARADAWRSLLLQSAQRAGERPLPAHVLASRRGPGNGRDDHQRLIGQREQVFALIARHPLLTRQQLASLLGTSSARIAQLVAQLVNQGWLRALTADDIPDGAVRPSPDAFRRMALVELTQAGRQEAARRLLVPAHLPRGITALWVAMPLVGDCFAMWPIRWAPTPSL
jgi:hypothetical protein